MTGFARYDNRSLRAFGHCLLLSSLWTRNFNREGLLFRVLMMSCTMEVICHEFSNMSK